MLGLYMLWSSLLLTCMGQVVKADGQVDVSQADGALASLVEDMQAALHHLEEGRQAMNAQLLQYRWPQLVGSAIINGVFDEAKDIVTNTSLAAIDALEKHFQIWSAHTKSLEQSLEECMGQRLCSEVRPWPKYPAQMEPFTVSVSSEGGCCAAITWEYQDGPLFRINGQLIKGSPKSRGFNIVAVDRRSGQIVRMGTFDTYGSAGAADRMVDFIRNAIPDDSIVLVGAFDSADSHCPTNSECVQALREIGGTRTTFGTRCSYALIGFKGTYCGRASYPTVVSEDYASYPGADGREGKQTAPVTIQATVEEITCR